MTIKQAFIAALHLPADDLLVEKALADNELTGTDNYTKDKSALVDNAVMDALQAMLSLADVTEGDYSIKYDRKSILSRLGFIAKKNNRQDILNSITDDKPTVTGKSVW